jgi:uncharacterized protein (TIGR02597 family)
MKHNLSLLTGALLFAVAAGANAQTAVTDPVGYITMNVYGGGTANNPRFTIVSPTLVNKVDFAGAIATVDTAGSKLTFTGNPLTAGAFNQVDIGGVNYPKYYVEVTSGPSEGAWRNITANTAGDITLASNFPAAVVAGATVKIRKHVTINELFGATNSAGLNGNEDAAQADEVIVLAPGAPPVSYFYIPTAGFEGWYDLIGTPSGEIPISPDKGLLISRKVTGTASFVRVGHVKTGKTTLNFKEGYNVMPVTLATGLELGDSQLFTGSLATGIKADFDAAIADNVIVLSNTGAAPATYFYVNDPGPPPFVGFFDLLGNDANGVVIPEGSGALLLRQAGLGAFDYTAPAQVIAP